MKTVFSRLCLLGIVVWILLALPAAPLAASSDPLTEEFQTCPFHTRMAAPENVMIAPGPRADEVTVYWQPLRPEQMGLGDLGQLTSVSVFVERRQSHGKVRELHKRHLPLGISMVTISDIPQPQSVEVTVGLTRQNHLISDTAQERFGRALRIQSLPPVTGFRAKIELPEDPAQASGIPQGAFVQVSAQSQTADENLRGEPDERNVKLLWDAPSSKVGLAGFRIERCASTTDCDSPLATYNLGPNFTEHTVLGLTRDTTYYFRITSLAIPGEEYEDSSPSAILAVTTLKTTLATVTGFSAQKTDAHDSVDLSWTKLASQDGLAGFLIDRCVSATDCDTPLVTFKPGPQDTTYTVTGLEGATTYYFRITAWATADSGYQDGDPSTIVTVTTEKTPLATVLNFQATAVGATDITLGWERPVHTAYLRNFRIDQCPSSNSCTSPTQTWDKSKSATSHTVNSLERKTDYYFRITAWANASSDYRDAEPSPILTVQTGKTPLAVVKGFQVSALKDTSVTLSWTAPTSKTGLKEFQIDRCTTADCTSVNKAGTANKNATNHTLQNLTANTTYYYRITAVAKNGLLQNGYQNSAPSTLLTVTTAKTPLAAATGFKQTDVTDTTVTLTWNAPSATGRSAFLIELRCTSNCTTPNRSEVAAANATSHTVTGLQANATYQFGITAHAAANSDYADSARVAISVKTGTTALAKVIDFEASDVKATSLKLVWVAPVSQTGLKDFLIEACTSTSNCTDPEEVATPGKNKTEHEVTGLQRKTAYYYRITARATANSDYRDSAPSTIIKVTTGKTPLAVVTGFKATAITDTSVTLGWTAPTDKTKLKEFRIDRCDKADCTGTNTAVATPDKDDTSHKVTQLTRNTTYHYRITAVTASRGYQDSVASTILTVTTAKTPLAKVTNFKATNTADTSVTLNWNAPRDKTNLGGFRIEQCPSASNCTGSRTDFNLAAGATSHTVKGLTPNTEYYFRITARAKANTDYRDAAPTAILTVTMGKSRLPQLMNFQATTVTETGITLGWTAPADKTDIKDFLIESCTSATDCTNPQEEATPGKDATSQALTDLTRNTTYYYRITVRAKASSEYRDAEPSGIITVTTGKTPLAVVKGFAATSIAETSLTLGWTAPTDKTGLKGFLIEECTSASDCSSPRQTWIPGKDATSQALTDLTRDTTYYYRITARATAGSNYQDSAVSTVLTVTTAKTPLATVTNFRATTIRETILTLGWQAPTDKTNLTGFRIETCRSATDCRGAITVFNLGANATSHTVKGLTANTDYYYRITALALDGSGYRNSAATTILTVTTQKNPLATVANFRATDNTANTRATLGWDTPSVTTDLDKFKLERCTNATCSGTPTLEVEPAKTETRHTIRDLTRNTTYYFRLTAIAKAGSQYRDSLPTLLTVTTADNSWLDTVDKFRVTAKTATTVTLAWHGTTPQTALGSYRLTTVSGGSLQSWSLGVSATSYTVTNLNPDTTYRFGMQALARSNSGYSNSGQTSVSVTTGKRLAAPQQFLHDTFQSDTTFAHLTWTWSGATTELDKFRLEKCASASDCTRPTLMAEPAKTDRSYTVKKLKAASTYYFRLTAIAKAGSTHESSAPSAIAMVRTRNTSRVPPVTNLQATATDTSVTLTWTAPTDLTNISDLWVSQTWPNSQSWSPNKNTTSHTVTGLKPNTNHHFEIQAVSSSGSHDSIWQRLWVATKQKLATPQLAFDSGNTGYTSVALTWTWTGAATDLAKFRLEKCASVSDCSSPTLVAEPASTARSYTVNDLTSNTTYYYRIQAQAKASSRYVDSVFSSTVSGTTDKGLAAPTNFLRDGINSDTTLLALAWTWTGTATDLDKFRLEKCASASDCSSPTLVAEPVKTARDYRVKNLTANTTYYYRLTAIPKDSNVPKGVSSILTAQTLSTPRRPPVTNFQGTATDTSVTLTWTAPTDLTHISNLYLEQTWPTGGTHAWNLDKNATSHTVTGRSPNTNHHFKIQALSSSGTLDSIYQKLWIATKQKLATPQLSVATDNIDATMVHLDWTWSGTATDVDKFRLERCADASCSGTPTLVAQPVSTARGHTVKSLTANTTYYFRVTAIAKNSNTHVNSASTILTVRTSSTSRIPPVANLQITAKTATSVTVAWNAPSSTTNLSMFMIEQCASSGDCSSATRVATPAKTVTRHTIANLTPNTTYRFRMQAVATTASNLENSIWSPFTVTTKPQLASVTNFRATATANSVNLTWDAPTSTTDLDKFRIERCATASCSGTPTEVATPAKTATSYKEKYLTADTTYYYRITAVATADSNYDNSAPSAVFTVTTTANPTLAAVTNFKKTATTNTSTTLTWEAPASTTGLGNFKIESCPDATCSGTPTQVATPTSTATTHTVPSLTGSTTYYYRITAVADANSNYADSTPSAVLTVTTQANPKLAAVTNFRQTATTDSSVTLAWDTPFVTTHVAGFKIESCPDATCSGTPTQVATPDETTTTHTVTSLTRHTTYYYRIIAVAGANSNYDNSTPSAVLTFTTAKTQFAQLNLKAITQPNSITLTWDAPASTAGLMGYYLCTHSSNCSLANKQMLLSNTTTSWTHTGLSSDTAYGYRIMAQATTNGGYLNSVPTSLSTKTLKYGRLPLTNFRATATGGNSITLAWDAATPDSALSHYEFMDHAGQFHNVQKAMTRTVQGLTPGTTYNFSVQAKVKDGSSYTDSLIQELAVTTLPRLPQITNFRSPTASKSSVTLAWDAPASATGRAGYQIQRCADSNCNSVGKMETVASTATSWVDTGTDLVPKPMYYRIKATASANGNYVDSVYSTLTVNPPSSDVRLPTVTNFRATATTDTSVTLGWDAPTATTGLASFRIERCTDATCSGTPTQVATPAKTATSHAVTSLTRNTTYYYRITAVAVGNGYQNSTPSAVLTVTTDKTTLATPGNFRVSATTNTSVTLAWTGLASTTGLDEYKIEKCTSTSDCTSPIQVATTPSHQGVTNYTLTVTDLTGNTTYYYRLTALATASGDYADSVPTTTLTVKTGQILLAKVVNFRATTTSDSSVVLAWDAPASTTGISKFRIDSCPTVICHTMTQVATPASTATTHTLTVTRNTTYYYRITALATANSNYADGISSDILTVTTPKTVLAPVSGLAAFPPTHNSIVIDWLAPTTSTGLDTYKLESCNDTACSTPSTLATLAKTVTTYTASNLTANTTYYYRITALATANSDYTDSAPSAVLTVKTAKTPLATVAGFQYTKTTATSVTLGWNAPASTTDLGKFRIQKCTSSNNANDCTAPSQVATPASTATSHTLTGLKPNTTYYYRIFALPTASSNYGMSAPSTTISVRTENSLDPVTNFKSTAQTSTSVTLSWDATPYDWSTMRYVIGHGTTTVTVGPKSSLGTSYTVTGLDPNTEYSFWIYIDDTADNAVTSPKASLDVKTKKITLATVTGFQATTITDTSVTLSWTAPSSTTGLGGFRIESCPDADCSSHNQEATPTSSDTGHTLSDLARNKTYYFRITATAANSDYLDSAASAVLTVTTLKTQLAQVAGFTGTYDSSTKKLTLSWTAPADKTNLANFKIEVCDTAQCTNTTGTPVTKGKDDTSHTQDLSSRSGTKHYRITAIATAGSDYQDSVPATTSVTLG